jgi:hypothetical protein
VEDGDVCTEMDHTSRLSKRSPPNEPHDGLMYVHVVGPDGVSAGRRLVVSNGNRWTNRWCAVDGVLELLIDALQPSTIMQRWAA